MDSQVPNFLGNLCHQGKRHMDLIVVLVMYKYHDDTSQKYMKKLLGSISVHAIWPNFFS